MLGGVGDPGHVLHCGCGVPPPVHAVQRAEPQPDDSPLLVEREQASADDDRVGFPLGHFENWPCRSLEPKPVLQERDLAVQLQSSTSHLGLGQWLVLLTLIHKLIREHMGGLEFTSFALASVLVHLIYKVKY